MNYYLVGVPIAGVIYLFTRKEAFFPAKGTISSKFGYRQFERGKDLHTGIDIKAAKNSNVLAAVDGTVLHTYKNGTVSNYGNLVIIKHGPNLYSLYAHLEKILINKNQKVLAGDIIGKVGGTAGNKDNLERKVPIHLHFEFLDKWPPVGKDLNRINPVTMFETIKEAGISVKNMG